MEVPRQVNATGRSGRRRVVRRRRGGHGTFGRAPCSALDSISAKDVGRRVGRVRPCAGDVCAAAPGVSALRCSPSASSMALHRCGKPGAEPTALAFTAWSGLVGRGDGRGGRMGASSPRERRPVPIGGAARRGTEVGASGGHRRAARRDARGVVAGGPGGVLDGGGGGGLGHPAANGGIPPFPCATASSGATGCRSGGGARLGGGALVGMDACLRGDPR